MTKQTVTPREARVLSYAMANPGCCLKNMVAYAGGSVESVKEVMWRLHGRGFLSINTGRNAPRSGGERGYTRYEIRAMWRALRAAGIDIDTADVPRVREKLGAF